jgi:hypothetical protein
VATLLAPMMAPLTLITRLPAGHDTPLPLWVWEFLAVSASTLTQPSTEANAADGTRVSFDSSTSWPSMVLSSTGPP